MPAALTLSGQRFGRLLVIERSHKNGHGGWMWLCQCDCGRSVRVKGSSLNLGVTKRCQSCANTDGSRTHGGTGTVLYSRWRSMLDRCENSKCKAWKNYGGRGITVCQRWHDFGAFQEDMGATFSPELELDRVDVNGPYDVENCRWSTRIVQQNNKRNNHILNWSGRTMTIKQWATELNLDPTCLLGRIRRGWSVERAMTTPSKRQTRRIDG